MRKKVKSQIMCSKISDGLKFQAYNVQHQKRSDDKLKNQIKYCQKSLIYLENQTYVIKNLKTLNWPCSGPSSCFTISSWPDLDLKLVSFCNFALSPFSADGNSHRGHISLNLITPRFLHSSKRPERHRLSKSILESKLRS